MIQEDYVSFEIAKLLKEKGFDEGCISYYVDYEPNDVKYSFLGETNSTWESRCCSAPTLQGAMKWLREKHNLFIFICPWIKHKDGTVLYYYEIRDLNDIDFETLYDHTSKELDSYEKTCDVAIKYCLKNLI